MVCRLEMPATSFRKRSLETAYCLLGPIFATGCGRHDRVEGSTRWRIVSIVRLVMAGMGEGRNGEGPGVARE